MEATIQNKPRQFPLWGSLSILIAVFGFDMGSVHALLRMALGDNLWPATIALAMPVVSLVLGIVGLIKRQYLSAIAGISFSLLGLYLPGGSECFVSYVNGPPKHCVRQDAGESRWKMLF